MLLWKSPIIRGSMSLEVEKLVLSRQKCLNLVESTPRVTCHGARSTKMKFPFIVIFNTLFAAMHSLKSLYCIFWGILFWNLLLLSHQKYQPFTMTAFDPFVSCLQWPVNIIFCEWVSFHSGINLISPFVQKSYLKRPRHLLVTWSTQTSMFKFLLAQPNMY